MENTEDVEDNLMPSGKEPYSKEDYYESNKVQAGRNDKECRYCGETIPKGEPHRMHKFMPQFYSVPTHDRAVYNPNNIGKSCSELFIEELV